MTKSIAAALAVIGVGGAAFASSVAPPEPVPWSVQLHMHGLSNHNQTDYPSSMEWHSSESQRIGMDLLWWTDHTTIFDMRPIARTWLIDGVLNPATLTVKGMRHPIFTLAPVGMGEREAELAGGALTITLDTTGGERGRFLYYLTGDNFKKIQTEYFCRHVASGAEVSWDVDVQSLPSGMSLVLVVDLAFHPDPVDGRIGHQILYQFVPPGDALPDTTVEGGQVLIIEEITPGPHHLVLDLLEPALLLPQGDDNTIRQVGFGVLGPAAAEPAVIVSGDVILSSRYGSKSHNFGAVQGLADRYATSYEVPQLVGYEYTLKYGRGEQPEHMNAFLPRYATGPPPFAPTEFRADEFCGYVHDLGGLVSVNHPFGTNPLIQYEQPPKVQEERARAFAHNLLTYSDLCHGDLLEVGYIRRGQVNLDYHLFLWDLLSSAGDVITGVGVSDNHGGSYSRDMFPNAFVSWIWAIDRQAGNMLRALSRGRVAFGDPFLFDGQLDIEIAGTRMGETLEYYNLPSLNLLIHVEDPDPSWTFLLVQGKAGDDIDYLRDHEPVDPSEPIPIDTASSGFVRIEIWNSDDEPVAFSNPIYLARLDGAGPAMLRRGLRID